MDINFVLEENKRVNHRVAAIIRKNDKILLHKKEGEDHWALPGGRVKFNETSEDAIKRELLEELELTKVENLKLLWTIENLFSKKDERVHELSFYYNIELEEDHVLFELESLELEEGNDRYLFEWFNLEELDNKDLRPKVIIAKIKNTKDETEHIINVEK